MITELIIRVFTNVIILCCSWWVSDLYFELHAGVTISLFTVGITVSGLLESFYKDVSCAANRQANNICLGRSVAFLITLSFLMVATIYLIYTGVAVQKSFGLMP